LRGAYTSAAVAGQYEIYDIGNNAILAGYASRLSTVRFINASASTATGTWDDALR